ncbi:hypothetical protein RUM43_000099 [Polyplax serrata]|uniref:Uncharacterized protein n=1 Tax=Polyplax serrata TaxID=468196 RepID=A0AAN8SDG9_POLSC
MVYAGPPEGFPIPIPKNTIQKRKKNAFGSLSNATKECTENGTWFISPKTHQEWTDYNKCFTNQETTIFVQVSPVDSILIKEYLPILKAISHVGYGISLVSLIVASIILFTCRMVENIDILSKVRMD